MKLFFISFIINKIINLIGNLAEWFRSIIWNITSHFFYSIRVDRKWEEEVKKVARKGKIIHVIRTVHFLDSLCLVYFSRRAGLPEIRYVYGLQDWFFRPLRWIYRFMTNQGKYVEDRIHAEKVLDEGGSIIICLRKTPKTLKKAGVEIGEEPLEWLIQRVKKQREDIYLIPHAFVWGRRPEKDEPGMIDKIFGPRESPGIIRSIIQVIRSFRSANIIVCEPLNLKSFIENISPSNENENIAKTLQKKLASEIDRKRTIIAGPALRSRYRTADIIMTDEKLLRVISEEAKRSGKSEEEVKAKVRKILDEIMPSYHYAFIDGWEIILSAFGVFDKVFDGIYLEPQEQEQLKTLASKGPIILLPGHRSHVDYILLSWVFAHICDLMVPHIAAGKNLSFWPLGWWFRGSAAFFIRRTIGEDNLYREVLAAFVRRTLFDGNHIEIFMEGTRSRSGKMLNPKLGLFSMVLEAALKLPENSDVNFLPVAINYDRVIEEKSYYLEQMGMEKHSEDIKALYETQDVLQSRFGRIYVRLGNPINIKEIRKEFSSSYNSYSVKRLAYRIFHEIDRSFHITPTGLAATTLLCCPGSAIGEEDFFKDAVFYFKFAVASGKKVSRVLLPCLTLDAQHIMDKSFQPWREMQEVMYHAIHLLADDDLVTMSAGGGGVYYVPPGARLRLDYYKNSFYGTMGAHALACKSLISSNQTEVPINELKKDAKFLSKLFKYEFIFNPNLSFEANFSAILLLLETIGLIEINGKNQSVKILEPQKIQKIGILVNSLLESYFITILSALSYVGKTVTEQEIRRRAFRIHERYLITGKLSHPESRNKSAISFCIKVLEDMQLLQESKEKHYLVAQTEDKKENLKKVAENIQYFLV